VVLAVERWKQALRHGTGRSAFKNGYMRVWKPGHPVANKDGYALEHRYVLYEAGVDVPRGMHVHHKNGDKSDNRVENLEVVAPGEHSRHHVQQAGVVRNGLGVWPLLTPEQKLEKDRARSREAARLRTGFYDRYPGHGPESARPRRTGEDRLREALRRLVMATDPFGLDNESTPFNAHTEFAASIFAAKELLEASA
jgi:hypothetical protein